MKHLTNQPQPPQATVRKRQLALLIAAHNEEMVLERTLRSAIAAGQKPQDIYVVDDNSSDATSRIARSVLPAANVTRVRRGGKGLALMEGAATFALTKRYRWVHIADADGAFASDYFSVFRRNLDPAYAACTGYLRSLPGSPVSQFRAYEYAVGMEVTRRVQAWLGVIPVIPGPTSCFRADVFDKINFANHSYTEDFEATLQIHRGRLGPIKFISGAVTYTQDPRTTRDFTRQILRWNHGMMQGIARYRIGRSMKKLDAYICYQIFQNFLFFCNFFFWAPYVSWQLGRPDIMAFAFICDVWMSFLSVLLSVNRSRRSDILAAFPQIYALRWLQLAVFLYAFFEVGLFKKHRHAPGMWSVAGRRYAAS